MTKIFISYRRQDTGDFAGRIYDYLIRAFNEENVYKDSYNLAAGIDFRPQLREAVANCTIMVVLVGNQWANVTDSSGNPRLHNQDDWVRFEVETALKRGKIPVLPILLKNAPQPTEKDLPPVLHDLCHRQSFVIRDDPYFPNDMQLLIKQLERHVQPLKKPELAAPTSHAKIQALIYKNQGLKESRIKLLAQLRNQAAIDEGQSLASATSNQQTQTLQNLLGLIAICIFSLSIGLLSNLWYALGAASFLLLLLYRFGQRKKPRKNVKENLERSYLKAQLELIDEVIARNKEEIDRLAT